MSQLDPMGASIIAIGVSVAWIRTNWGMLVACKRLRH